LVTDQEELMDDFKQWNELTDQGGLPKSLMIAMKYL